MCIGAGPTSFLLELLSSRRRRLSRLRVCLLLVTSGFEVDHEAVDEVPIYRCELS